jgi:hypothetical protein
MITRDAYTQKIRSLPPLMRAILSNEALTQAAMDLDDRFSLTHEQSRMAMEIEYSIIAQEYAPSEVLTHAISMIRLPDDQARLFAAEFLGTIVMPMQWYVGNVEHLIQQYGGDLSYYKSLTADRFPELANPTVNHPASEDQAAEKILEKFTERLSTFAGRAEILFRLTGLASQVEDAVRDNRLSASQGEQMITDLDSMSSAINTRDLNPFEVEALKRRLTRLLTQLTEALK